MNYEKIIVELLGRIQVLEEQMAMLLNAQDTDDKESRITTKDIRDHIAILKEDARAKGQRTLVLVSGELHKELNLKSRMPIVCNAMRQSMQTGDVILHTTPSGNSSTIEIKYHL